MRYKLKNINVKAVLIVIFASLVLPAGIIYAENVMIQADKQTFDGEKTVFQGNVKVDYSDITVKSPKAIVRNDKQGKASGATFIDGAHAVKTTQFSRSEVKANIINLSLLKNRIKAEGSSESFIFQDKKPMVHIQAGSQEFDIKKNIIVATDEVNIKYEKIQTYSNKAMIIINKEGKLDKVEFLGNVKINQDKTIVNADNVIYNPTTEEMTASGNTHSTSALEDNSTVVIWADFQQYDNLTKTLITSGHVKIKYKDYVATGPKATFIPDEKTGKPNKIMFIGRAKIQEGQRFVEGDRIQLTLDPKNFEAEGNVKTRFTDVQDYKQANTEANKEADK
ncbi:MAG TPA: LptA/OstA family protein [Candidatus Gastranaerophilales bacterium]|nr:LptA/OstA family protein [Candidatus Gastranaerophilales bacterium]